MASAPHFRQRVSKLGDIGRHPPVLILESCCFVPAGREFSNWETCSRRCSRARGSKPWRERLRGDQSCAQGAPAIEGCAPRRPGAAAAVHPETSPLPVPTLSIECRSGNAEGRDLGEIRLYVRAGREPHNHLRIVGPSVHKAGGPEMVRRPQVGALGRRDLRFFVNLRSPVQIRKLAR